MIHFFDFKQLFYMAHEHTHHASSNIKVAFFLNLGFTILEVIGGLYTNSIAIVSDAVHDLGDSLALGMAWWLSNVAQKPASKTYSFGYKRFSLLGALVNSVVLIIGAFFVLSEAIPRILEPEEADAVGMLWFAIFGILVNGAAVLKMKKGRSLNEKVVTWHLLEDVLGWVAVLITSIVLIYFDFYILDPILAVLISIFILWNIIKRLREVLNIFLQGVPSDVSIDQLEAKIMADKKIESLHNTHIWSFDGEHHVLSTHLVMAKESSLADMIEVKGKVKSLLRDLSIVHSTIEIELLDEDCYMFEESGR